MIKFEDSITIILEELKKTEPNKIIILDNIHNLMEQYLSLGEDSIKVFDKYDDLIKKNKEFINKWLEPKPEPKKESFWSKIFKRR